MATINAKDLDPHELLTLPAMCRELGGVPIREARRAYKVGELRGYDVGGWPRVRRRDGTIWLESKRVRPTSHARARVDEVLEREKSA